MKLIFHMFNIHKAIQGNSSRQERTGSEKELKVLKKVAAVFKGSGTQQMIELSHQEEAWIKNEKEKSVISYEYAFDLKEV